MRFGDGDGSGIEVHGVGRDASACLVRPCRHPLPPAMSEEPTEQPSEWVRINSKDGFSFLIKRSAAIGSGTLANMLSTEGTLSQIICFPSILALGFWGGIIMIRDTQPSHFIQVDSPNRRPTLVICKNSASLD